MQHLLQAVVLNAVLSRSLSRDTEALASQLLGSHAACSGELRIRAKCLITACMCRFLTE
jgi:hypothetical protein